MIGDPSVSTQRDYRVFAKDTLSIYTRDVLLSLYKRCFFLFGYEHNKMVLILITSSRVVIGVTGNLDSTFLQVMVYFIYGGLTTQ